MKKNATAETTTAIVTSSAEQDAAALAQIEGLEDMQDGLGKLRPEDVKIRSYVLNMKGVSPVTGRKIPEDEYYDTLEESSKPEVNAVILLRRNRRAYTQFDQGEQRTKRICSSADEVAGRMADGTTRPCKGCPDWRWTQRDGKPHRNCGPVLNLYMYDRDTQQPFVLRAKRTSLGPAEDYLQRHHIGQLKGRGKPGNMPLFVFQCQLSAKMEPGGKYALPVFTRGPVLTSAEVHQHKLNSEGLDALLDAMLDSLDEADSGGGEPAPDTSFDPDRFGAPANDNRAFTE